MKKYKVGDKLKKVLISIICIIMLIFTMPVRAKAAVLDDFLDVILCIPDAIEFCLNKWISNESFDKTTEEINVKGWDKHGRLPDFLVTPYEIFCAGTEDEDGKIMLPLLDANFFKEDSESGEVNSADILKPVVSNTYNSLSTLVVVLMMLVLLYIGIRIIVATVSTDQVKYKQMIMDWLVAICLLFCMHYIMSFIMTFNEMVIEILADKSSASDEYYIGLGKAQEIGINRGLNYGNESDVLANEGTQSFTIRHLVYPTPKITDEEKFTIDKNGLFSKGYIYTNKYVEKVAFLSNRILAANATTTAPSNNNSTTTTTTAPSSSSSTTTTAPSNSESSTTTTGGVNPTYKNKTTTPQSTKTTINGSGEDPIISSGHSDSKLWIEGKDIEAEYGDELKIPITVSRGSESKISTIKHIELNIKNNAPKQIESTSVVWDSAQNETSEQNEDSITKVTCDVSNFGVSENKSNIGEIVVKLNSDKITNKILITLSGNIDGQEIGASTFAISIVGGVVKSETVLDEIDGKYISASIGTDVRVIYKGNLVEYMRAISSFDHDEVTFYSKDNTRQVGKSGSLAQNFGYGVLYIIIVIETVVFIIKYIGRVINLAFLTAIAPLIAFMYPIDRIGDSKAQTFNTWFKDYLYRALLQPLDLLLYTIFIYGAYTLMDKSVIYAIGMYAFMLVAEKYFKKLFGFDKTAAGGGGLGSPLAGALTMRGLDKLSGTGPGSKRGAGGGGASGESSKPKIKIPKRKFEKSGAENNSSEKTSLMPNSNGAVKRKGTAVPKSGGNTSKNGKSRMPLLGSIGKTAGRRFSKAVTGGKYDHLKGTKGGFFKAAAGNAAKSVGRTGIRTVGKIGGAVLGAGAGLLAGSIATAVTGDVSNLSKGIEAGGFTGWNRGGQIADYGMGRAGDFVDEVNAWRATKDPDYRDKVLRDNSLKTWQDDLSQCSSEDRAKYEETIKDFSPYIRDFESFDQIKAMSKMRDEYKDRDGNIDMDKMEDVLNTTKDVGRFNLDKKEDRENLKSKLLEDAKEKGLEGPELYASVKKDFERRIKYHKALND